jgi:hypothetical protein
MKKNIAKIAVLSLFTATLVALPALSRAQDTGAPTSPDQTAPAKPKKHGDLRFHGKLSAVDTNAKTLTVGELTLQVTADTKITKNGQPATLADGVVGQPVAGSYQKTADGKLNAVSVHFGAKGGGRKKEASDAGN